MLLAYLPWLSVSAAIISPQPSEHATALATELSTCHRAAKQVAITLQARSNPLAPPARIAVIIDDLGYNRRLGYLAAGLPGQLTLAILPRSPHARWLAEHATTAGKEVIVHLPMTNIAGRPLDDGGLTDAMDRETFVKTLRENLRAVTQAKGANNHMGSLLTQQREPMEWLMDELSLHGLYFVDSRTTPKSVAGTIARERGLPSLEREIFLDNEKDCTAIAEQFLRLGRVAQRHGQSVAIGHPYPETLAFLGALLPELNAAGLVLLPVSQLLPVREKAEAFSPAFPHEHEREPLINRSMK